MAKLYFRYGAMNCGKSTAVIQVVHNYEERGMRAIIIKPKTDTKGGEKVVSRLGIEREADLVIAKGDDAYQIISKYLEHTKVDCILVDEVQFFTSEQIDAFFYVAVKLSVPVICYGLRTDFLMDGFEGSQRLLLIAHSIEELKTICRCGKKALLNARKINGEFVFAGDQVAIDGENQVEYESLCPNCYIEKRSQFEKTV